MTNTIEEENNHQLIKFKRKLKKALDFFNDKSLKKLYGFDYFFIKKINKNKQDNTIATEKDFTINSYQERLVRIIAIKIISSID